MNPWEQLWLTAAAGAAFVALILLFIFGVILLAKWAGK
jgi:hypothetical protein